MRLIRISERDTASLERLRDFSARTALPQPQSYKNRVVVKPWGYEFLVYQNNEVAVWFLHIKKGHSTSMHCHPTKKTALIVLSGQALCNTFYNRNYLNGIDSVVIEKGVFHSTQCLSSSGADIIEIETPPNKTDLVRLNDQYGRESAGYEGMSEMKVEGLDRYGYFAFDEDAREGAHSTSKYELSLLSCPPQSDPGAFFSMSRDEVLVSCSGRICEAQGNVVIDVGDATEGAFLTTFEKLSIPEPALFLRARPR